MRLPRFRIRTLMIAVAVVGLAFGGLAGLQRMDQRRQRFHALARNHLQQELVNHLRWAELVAHRTAEADIKKYRVLAEYHHTINRKYYRAARYPWLPVGPDPPEPK